MGSIPAASGFSYFGFDDSKNSEKNPTLGQGVTQFGVFLKKEEVVSEIFFPKNLKLGQGLTQCGVFFRILSAAGFEEFNQTWEFWKNFKNLRKT